mgnify:FL=1
MEKEYKINDGNLILDVIITQEKISGKIFFVAQGIQIDVASQGLSLDEALENIKDAAKIVLENSHEKMQIIRDERREVPPLLTRIFL